MLWRKELKKVDSLYVDFLCDSSDDDFTDFNGSDTDSTMPAKSNQLAKHYQLKGAEHCQMKNWFEAIELYIEALCFAESDSIEWVSILTDRASCFFQLKMYDECLVDVKLVKAKEDAQLFMPKLNKLAAMCGQNKHRRENNDRLIYQFKPTLSFNASKDIPFAANVIGIEKKKGPKNTKERGFFQAKHSIEVGKTILIEDGYVAKSVERYKRCCICMKSATNLIPCENCTNSLFCYATCKRQACELHQVECNTTLTKSESDEIDADIIIRSILMAFKITPNVNDLICFVEKVLFDQKYDLLASTDFGISARSKYAIFLKKGQKMLHLADKYDFDFINVVNDIYKVLMGNDDFSAQIELPDHHRFLQHLIGHHMCALKSPNVNVEIGENDGTVVHSVFAHLFTHSCYPNVVLVTSGRSVVAVTIRPIQKNEPFTISYLPGSLLHDFGFVRRFWLRKNFKFQCECERCVTPNAESRSITKLGLSPQFYVDCAVDAHYHHKMQKMRKRLTSDCVKYLNANERAKWNIHIDLATRTYLRLLREKFYLNLHY